MYRQKRRVSLTWIMQTSSRASYFIYFEGKQAKRHKFPSLLCCLQLSPALSAGCDRLYFASNLFNHEVDPGQAGWACHWSAIVSWYVDCVTHCLSVCILIDLIRWSGEHSLSINWQDKPEIDQTATGRFHREASASASALTNTHMLRGWKPAIPSSI